MKFYTTFLLLAAAVLAIQCEPLSELQYRNYYGTQNGENIAGVQKDVLVDHPSNNNYGTQNARRANNNIVTGDQNPLANRRFGVSSNLLAAKLFMAKLLAAKLLAAKLANNNFATEDYDNLVNSGSGDMAEYWPEYIQYSNIDMEDDYWKLMAAKLLADQLQRRDQSNIAGGGINVIKNNPVLWRDSSYGANRLRRGYQSNVAKGGKNVVSNSRILNGDTSRGQNMLLRRDQSNIASGGKNVVSNNRILNGDEYAISHGYNRLRRGHQSNIASGGTNVVSNKRQYSGYSYYRPIKPQANSYLRGQIQPTWNPKDYPAWP